MTKTNPTMSIKKSSLKQLLEELKEEKSAIKKDTFKYAYLAGRIEQVEMILDQITIDEIPGCTCKERIGETNVWCCNICGKPTEESWVKGMEQFDGWISVEEQLPDNMYECLVWYTSKMCQPHIRTATYLGNNIFSTGGIHHESGRVIFWHPFPAPPDNTPTSNK